jgi:CheY-like chemotaxis protein/HPt (histidine-containing phosphotransfer) domain-containing protein
VERLRKTGATIPPIVMLLHTDRLQEDTVRCRNLKVADYLVKPVRRADLENVLRDILGTESLPKPLPFPNRSATAKAALPARAPGRQPPRILLAEDNRMNRRVVEALAKRRGWRLAMVETGREALAILGHERFDLVLMDVQMPDMDGLEATRKIRGREGASGGHLAILGLTAHARAEDRAKCLAAGMDDYLAKPLDPKAFYEVVERLLGSAATRADAAGEDDFAGLARALEEPDSLVRDLARDFLDDLDEELRSLESALEAGDGTEIERRAHGLKSVVGLFHAQTAFDLCRQLEALGADGRIPEARSTYARLHEELTRLSDFLRSSPTLSVG